MSEWKSDRLKTESDAMLPTFLIIGAMKSGTTSLYHYLKQHPDVFMPENKEPQFFSDDNEWKKGVSWYRDLFRKANGAIAVGEASTDYTKYPLFSDVPHRIKSLVPSVKMLYILRPPMERIYSHYLHSYYMGRVGMDAGAAIRSNPLFLDVSRYRMQLNEYLAVFPKSQIKVILLDDIKTNPVETIKDVFEYIGVKSDFRPSNIGLATHVTRNKHGRDTIVMKSIKKMPFYGKISNLVSENNKLRLNRLLRTRLADTAPEFDEETIHYIYSNLEDDINRLSDYLERDLSHWKGKGNAQRLL